MITIMRAVTYIASHALIIRAGTDPVFYYPDIHSQTVGYRDNCSKKCMTCLH